MKRFSSYGPPNPKVHFMVERPALVEQIAGQLEGAAEEGGHYFTVFAPRQVGKTTVMRQVVTHLRQKLGSDFNIGMATMHSLQDFRRAIPKIFRMAFGLTVKTPKHWDEVQEVFYHGGPLKKPTLLILDEFDGLPPDELAEAVASFRQLYLERDINHLHGLALIGVHSSLGKLEGRTSPFNVQRSVHIPNFLREEVIDLYGQYTAESGQPIAPEGVERIYDMFRGQPGLTCWFGELLTEKHNQVKPPPWERDDGPPPKGYPPITLAEVDRVLNIGQFSELNINIRNLISKGLEHKDFLRELFVRHDVRFDLYKSNIQWLYLNGIVVGEPDPKQPGKAVCAFASPFVQSCLFSAFGDELSEAYKKTKLTLDSEDAALGPAKRGLDVPVLLQLYRSFLARQAEKGTPPWADQPARTDARAFEAIGHFNLYAWLYGVALDDYSVAPEFPTGNGTADLLLMNYQKGLLEVLEVKSFTSSSDLDRAVEQAARYARKLKLPRSYLVVMVDASAYKVLRTAPTQHDVLGVKVGLEVIPWGFVPGGVPQGMAAPLSAVESGSNQIGTTIAAEGGIAATPRAAVRTHTQLGLTTAERLKLEALVTPLLTADTLNRLWRRCGFDPPRRRTKVLLDSWDALVTTCLTQGRMSDLATVVAFTFPELKAHPLLTPLESA